MVREGLPALSRRVWSITTGVTIAQVAVLVWVLVESGSGSPNTCVLYALGGAFAPDISLHWRLSQLFSTLGLHASIPTLLLCAALQWKTGTDVEAYYGKWRFATILIVAGLAGSAAAVVFDTYTVLACASCLLFALLGGKGATFLLDINLEDPSRLENSLFHFTSFFTPFALVSLWPHSSLAGHLYAYVAGALIGLLTKSGTYGKCTQRGVIAVAAVLLTAEFWWLADNMWYVIDFLDCEFLPYIDQQGTRHFSGPECLSFCEYY